MTKIGIGLVFVGLLGTNLLAWSHVRAMTRFSVDGERTPPPEELGLLAKVKVLAFGVTIPRPENDVTPVLPFETHRVAVETGGSVEVWRVPATSPRGTVVLFHGYAGTKDTLLPLVAPYHELGFDTLLVDFRGSGGSTGSHTTLSVREAEDVAAVARWAQRFDGPLVLHGFSMGGAAAIRAVANDPSLADGLIVESVFDALSTTVGHRFERLGLPAFPGTPLLLFWGCVELGGNAFAVQPAQDAARVQIPMLTMSGALDPRVRPDEARRVGEAAPGGRFVLLEGHGHGLGVGNAEWKAEVVRFLASLPG